MNINEVHISSNDFNSVNWEEIITQHQSELFCISFRKIFSEEATKYEEQTSEWKVFRLLEAISSFTLNIDPDSDDVYIPMFVFENARGLIPQDLTEQQYEALSTILDKINHPDLKARLADILWVMRIGNQPYRFAEIAIDAYLAIVEMLLLTEKHQIRALKRLKRAIHLSKEINLRQNSIRERIEYHIVNSNLDNIVKLELLEILEKYYKNHEIDVIKITQDFAEELTNKKIYILAIRCWENNSFWNRHNGDEISTNQSLHKIASLYELQAEEAIISEKFIRASYFFEQAILQYRKIPNTQSERQICSRKLLECEKRIPDQLTTHALEINIQDFVESAKDYIKGRSLQEAILILGLSEKPIEKKFLKQELSEIIKENPLNYLVQRSTIDDLGRTVAKNSANDSNLDDEEFIRNEMYSHSLQYQSLYVSAYIIPSLQQLNFEHRLEVEHLRFLVNNNPFIPPGAEYLIMRGLLAGFKNDFIVSSHILGLQIEGILRHILDQNGIITSSLSDEGIQEVFDINKLLNLPVLQEIFGEDLIFDLQGLLISRYGSNFRNKLAHSIMKSQDFYHSSSIYLWWITLKLICLPFIKKYLDIIEDVSKKDNQ